jgi:threonine/homoserine/homoserine lactone efflux protein
MDIGLVVSMAVYSFVLAISPGPNTTAVFALGGRFGFRGAVPYLWGMVVGLSVLAVLMAVGLGALFDAFPAVFQVMKYLAFAYIVYLAFRTLIPRKVAVGEEGQKPIGFVQSSAFQLINPKAWIVTATLMSAYVPVGSAWWAFGIAAATFVIATMPGAIAWAAAGQVISRWLKTPRARLIFGIVMALALIASMVPVLFLV